MSTQTPIHSNGNRIVLSILGLAYLLFVDYGSLIPFDFNDSSFLDAWRSFWSSADQINIVLNQDTATNVLLSIPLAFFLFGVARSNQEPNPLALAIFIVVFCMVDAAIIEVFQGLLSTRTSNLRDVLAQGVGAAIGVSLWLLVGNNVLRFLEILIFRYQQYENKRPIPKLGFGLLCVAYLCLLLMFNGYFSNRWLPFELAVKKIAEVHLAPFYGHYFASTLWATTSVLQYFAMYLPVGLLWWLWQSPSGTRHSHELRLKWVLFLAATLAIIVESGKLFLAEKIPDITNVALAVIASAAAFVGWPCFVKAEDGRAVQEKKVLKADISSDSVGFSLSRAIALLIWGQVLFTLVFFPLGSWWLSIALFFYLYALRKFPACWLVVVPALLPVLDLAPWSGRFFFNEFDLLLLTTLAAGLWNSATAGGTIHIAALVKIAFLLFSFSSLISLLIGLLPLSELDFNAFSNYFSHYNSLLAAKGFCEAAAFVPLLMQTIRAGHDVMRGLSLGMTLGLAATVVAGIWERAVFPGLFDFSSSFRISALFSSMHTGDSPVETYLVSALPFALGWAYFQRSWWTTITILLLFMTGVYALFVTYARGGYAAFAVSMSILFAGILLNSGRTRDRRRVLLPVTALFIFCASLVALPVLQGDFAQARLGVINQDMDVRLTHWRNAMDIADSDWGTRVFGMGLGRFPETYFFRNPAGKFSATYHVNQEDGGAYLSLGSGEVIYVEQIVRVSPNQQYKLTFDLRNNEAGAGFNVMLCERTFFESYNCRNFSQEQLNQAGEWQHYQTVLHSGALGQGPWFARRTVKLILENIGPGVAIDIDNIHLLDSNGNDVVENGEFSHGMDHWFFSAFNHLAWHVKNIFVQLVFEQGWLGLSTFIFLTGLILYTFVMASLRGQIAAAVIFSSLVGFLCVGLFGSPLDAPRMAFLFYLLLFSGYLAFQPQREFGVAGIVRKRTNSWGRGVENVQPQAWIDDRMIEPTVPEKVRLSAGNAASLQIQAIDRKVTTIVGNFGWFKPFRPLIGGLTGLTLVAAIVLNSPVVPYNIRELMHETHPWLALFFLSTLVIWTFGFPVVIAFLITKSAGSLYYPLFLLMHGLFGWVLLSVAVPLESIHDIVGSPVLEWGWNWEIAGRFIALYSALSLTATPVFLIVNKTVFRAPLGLSLGVWSLTAMLFYPICYEVVVSYAATDNLIELMADGGSIVAVFYLSAFWALLNLSGYILAIGTLLKNKLLESLLILVFIGFPLGYWLLNQGLESTVVKFDSVFSGLQFLLSTDRQHYLQGFDLMWRYIVFHSTVVLLMMSVHRITLRSLRNFSITLGDKQ